MFIAIENYSCLPKVRVEFRSDSMWIDEKEEVGVSLRFDSGHIYEEMFTVYEDKRYYPKGKKKLEFDQQRLAFTAEFEVAYASIVLGKYYNKGRKYFANMTMHDARELHGILNYFPCWWKQSGYVNSNKPIDTVMTSAGMPEILYHQLNHIVNEFTNLLRYIPEELIDCRRCGLRPNKRDDRDKIRVTRSDKLKLIYGGKEIKFKHITNENNKIKVVLHRNGKGEESIHAVANDERTVALTRNATLEGIPWGAYIPIETKRGYFYCDVSKMSGKMMFNQRTPKTISVTKQSK